MDITGMVIQYKGMLVDPLCEFGSTGQTSTQSGLQHRRASSPSLDWPGGEDDPSSFL
jgi:hypothetical protein